MKAKDFYGSQLGTHGVMNIIPTFWLRRDSTNEFFEVYNCESSQFTCYHDAMTKPENIV